MRAVNTFSYCEKSTRLWGRKQESVRSAVSTLDHTRQPINQEGAHFFPRPFANKRARSFAKSVWFYCFMRCKCTRITNIKGGGGGGGFLSSCTHWPTCQYNLHAAIIAHTACRPSVVSSLANNRRQRISRTQVNCLNARRCWKIAQEAFKKNASRCVPVR